MDFGGHHVSVGCFGAWKYLQDVVLVRSDLQELLTVKQLALATAPWFDHDFRCI